MTEALARTVRAPRGTELSCKGWAQEAALRISCRHQVRDLAGVRARHPAELLASLLAPL